MKPAVALMTLALLAVPAMHAEDKPAAAPKIAAVVNGETITVDELDRMYSQISPEMRAAYDKAGGKSQFLDTMIRKKLILQQATRENFQSRPEVVRAIAAARDSVVFDHYIHDVVANGIVSEADVRTYYDAHLDDFKTPPRVHVRHILMTLKPRPNGPTPTKEEVLARMNTVAGKLKSGVPFEQLVTQYSEDTTAKPGGDLGWLVPGEAVPGFDKVAFSLKKGETSGVFESEVGFHIIQIVDRTEEGPAPFSEVHDEIRERLLSDKMQDVLAATNQLSQQLRVQGRVQMFPENF